MLSTFGYSKGQMLIATKAWSDFANHIPLIRSFSLGSNFPPQDPLYAGHAIRYHFIFYQFVGLLEKLGVRIDWALNLPSIIGFFVCLLAIYYFAKKLFSSKAVGILSVLFFLFNGSLDFIYFFSKQPLSFRTPVQIITNTKFPSFGPYDSGLVSAFWNLNIYTNQRHLAAAFALSLALIGLLISYAFNNRKPTVLTSIIVGIILGASFYFHLAVFLMTIIVVGCLFFLFTELRLSAIIILVVTAIIAFPQYLYLKSGASGTPILFAPGYLVHDHLTVLNFVTYWFYNLGLNLFLIPIGFFLAPKNVKKVFLAFLPLFIIGNLFQFEPEMAANHKFFNYFVLIGSMMSASVLVTAWKNKPAVRPVVVIFTFFLMLSGIIDFFPIYNDTKIALADYPVNPDANWIKNNTPPNSVFFNTQYLYDSASIAGRKIFLGWPYFPWSSGFDTTTRSNGIKFVLSSNNSRTICQFMLQHKLDYVFLTSPSDDFPFSPQFWKSHFHAIYVNSTTGNAIYARQEICTH